MIVGDPELDRPSNGAQPEWEPSVGDPIGSIDEITRRLDDLLQTVSDAPDGAEPPALKDGILRVARRAWKAQRERERILGPSLAADPAWIILLDLFIARMEEREVTVRSLRSATGLSEATILRWVAQLVQVKMVLRLGEEADPRVARLALTEAGLNGMCDYFIRISPDLDVVAG